MCQRLSIQVECWVASFSLQVEFWVFYIFGPFFVSLVGCPRCVQAVEEREQDEGCRRSSLVGRKGVEWCAVVRRLARCHRLNQVATEVRFQGIREGLKF